MNIYDIAKLSGVSIATVSRVVNGSPRVSEKTKQKAGENGKRYPILFSPPGLCDYGLAFYFHRAV